MTKESPVSPNSDEVSHRAPAAWAEVQEKLASVSGLSILLVDGPQPPELLASNNNSVCHTFQSSSQHVALCDPYCGDAHRRAMEAGATTTYKCHAGLECFTQPIQIGKRKKLAVIGGRAFFNASDYRALVDRFRTGDLKSLLPNQPFASVIFSDEQKLEQLAVLLEKAAHNFSATEESEAPETAETEVVKAEPIPAEQSKPTPEFAPEPDSIAKMTEELADKAELARLKSELEYRTRLTESLQSFSERISSADPKETYNSILTTASELLEAERASLLVCNEVSNELVIKASHGLPPEATEGNRMRLGEGIAGGVLARSKPLVVSDIDVTPLPPSHRNYKTKSFISYPITIAGRRIGVLNVTDKRGGRNYDDVDLSLLEIIGPQIAVALERAEWQERATEFQLMSITDPLTKLTNRRYLEERLTEEVSRSKRYSYPMSFLMIDIDDFKNYNDLNGHQAGDQAIQITAHNLKAALRSADVASRYGGEEFCILLPQTPLHEAIAIAERIRQRVANTDYAHGSTQPLGAVTISIGIATFGKHIDSPESMIAAADRALYSAKSLGKNRIEIYQDNLVFR